MTAHNADKEAHPAMVAMCGGCSGMAYARVDTEDTREEMAEEIAECIRSGLHVTRSTVGEVRRMAWCSCP